MRRARLELLTGKFESRILYKLPDRPETSNFLRLALPIVLVGGGRNQRKITIDINCISDYLELSYRGKARLAQVFAANPVVKVGKKRQPLDYRELARKYQQLIDNGACRNRAEVARYMGVSRAWVSKVIKRGSG